MLLPKGVVTYNYPCKKRQKFQNLIFEIVATYFYPKAYTSYAELGRIRGKISENYLLERTSDS